MGKFPLIEADALFRFPRLATDQKTIAERQWHASLKPRAAQLPCDVGLFGDEHLQLDLVEMLQDPAND